MSSFLLSHNKISSRNILIFLCLILLLSICGFLIWFVIKYPRPYDNQMLDNYYQHKTEFNELAQLLVSEKELYVIYPSAENCELQDQTIVNAANYDVCNRAVQLGKQLGINVEDAESVDGSYLIWVSCQGIFLRGSCKGYAYITSPPDHLVENTDTDATHDPISDDTLYRHIEGNWYIVLSIEG